MADADVDLAVDADSLALPVTDHDHIYGPSDAAVTIVEYGEFECPHCGRAHFQLKPLRDRLDELSTRIVFRHLARDDVHPFAVRAAVTAEAAHRQGRFWEMHNHLFEHQHQLEYDDLKRHAAAIGLDMERFLADVTDPELRDLVRSHGAGAVASGVTSTPTFFVNGRRYEGSYDTDSLIAMIREELDPIPTS